MTTAQAKKQRWSAARTDCYQRRHEREKLDVYGLAMQFDPPPTPEQIVLEAETRQAVSQYIDGLQPRIARVLRLRNGLGCRAHTLDEVAAAYDVTRERVRQIEARGHRILKRRLLREYRPEEYCRQRETAARAHAEKRERAALDAALAASNEAARAQARRDEDSRLTAVDRERIATIAGETLYAQFEARQERATQRAYSNWVAEREAWLRRPVPRDEDYIPGMYARPRLVRDWLYVASHGSVWDN